MNILLFLVYFIYADYSPEKKFANTNWIGKVANKCVESINLRGNNYAVRYSKKSAQTYRGCYTVSKDTLIIKERDDFGGTVAYHKIRYLLKNQELHYYSTEELVNHQWKKTRSKADQNCVFSKI
ncbi:MAG: hypothetical protein EOP42_01070 [Sphingobacteriaceae bacterium]|nr:MAG: hypothetical protein EOP42_01070 [Sphingobacteriaceae bacterium]